MATSAFADNSRSGRTMAEINITPLVDVMLVLLVIFMIAAPMVTRSLDMRIPQIGEPSPDKPPRIALTVRADGSFLLDGAVLSARALQPALVEIAHAAPNTIVEIGAVGEADYQSFTDALAAARSSGIANIALQK
ncbi:MAG TPA: biopolymer transporter ExbD [Lysobacter sp.]